MKKFGSLSSSVNPEKLSTTVSGVFIGGAVVIIWIAKWLGFEITTDEVTTLGVQIGSMVSTFVILYGLIRKTVVAIQQKFSN